MSKTLHQWLAEAPFGLTMSSGFFGFFAHCGVLNALLDNGLKPSSCSGSSAGALITGLWSAGLPAKHMRDELQNLSRHDFWDPAPGLGVLKGQKFRQKLLELLPHNRIEDCPIPWATSVYNPLRHRTEVLSEGDLAAAIQASCTVPIMFHPVWIKRRPYLDGGVLDRPGLAGMQAERVFYHHLLSRSPWRPKNGAQTRLPERDQLKTLALEGLPRPSPFNMSAGRAAYQQAYDMACHALSQPAPKHSLQLSHA